MSTPRRTLGTGTDRPVSTRDPRARSAVERAIGGDWVEVPAPDPAPAPTGRRRLGPRADSTPADRTTITTAQENVGEAEPVHHGA
jgi:hypothetical protein